MIYQYFPLISRFPTHFSFLRFVSTRTRQKIENIKNSLFLIILIQNTIKMSNIEINNETLAETIVAPKTLPIKYKTILFSSLKFIRDLRDKNILTEEIAQACIQQIPVFETLPDQIRILDDLYDLKHIEQTIVKPMLQNHKKMLKQATEPKKRVYKKKESPSVDVETTSVVVEKKKRVYKKKESPSIVVETTSVETPSVDVETTSVVVEKKKRVYKKKESPSVVVETPSVESSSVVVETPSVVVETPTVESSSVVVETPTVESSSVVVEKKKRVYKKKESVESPSGEKTKNATQEDVEKEDSQTSPEEKKKGRKPKELSVVFEYDELPREDYVDVTIADNQKIQIKKRA